MKVKKKKKTGKKLNLRDFICLALGVYLVVLLFTQQSTLDRNRTAYGDLQQKINVAKNENPKLKEVYSQVGSGEYIEEKAREAGLVKSDEVVFVMDN